MVEKITLIEPHLEGAQFAPDTTETQKADAEVETSSSRRVPFVGFLSLLIAGIVIGVAAKYLRQDSEESITIEPKTSPLSLWSRE